MLEPDVTLTDLMLAAECFAFSLVLLRLPSGKKKIRRLYSALFGALGLSSVLGALWHGVFSGPETAIGDLVWFLVMASLALAAALLWLISAALLPSARVARLLRGLALLQLVVQTSVSAFVTDSFAVAPIGLLPPLSLMIALYAASFRRTRGRHYLLGIAGFSLAALAGLVIAFDVSLHPRWATTQAVFHMVQFVAFGLVFLSASTEPHR